MTIVARITGDSTNLDIAEETAKAVLSSSSATPIFTYAASLSLGLIAVQRADVAAAAEQYSALEPYRGTMMAPNVWWTSADRLLGLLSQTMGSLDQASSHFEDAIAFCRKAGYRPELAWTCCEFANSLTERNGPEDRAKANALLDESLVIAAELGMRPLMERVKESLEQIQTLPDMAPTHPDGLTQREVEVLRLIAAGKTNLEIAEDLVIAEGTARRHVSNIYEKIGAGNRAEATRYAIREAILPAEDNLTSSA